MRGFLMAYKTLLASIAAFVLAIGLAFVSALGFAGLIEQRNVSVLEGAFSEAGMGWLTVTPDGLRVLLAGEAPDEGTRIRALQIAGQEVDASRIDEAITVPVQTAIVAPVFRMELMRSRAQLSVIGLVPTHNDAGPLTERLSAVSGIEAVEDMLQTSDHAVPQGWVPAVNFALDALSRFDVGRVSVTSGRIEVEALVPTTEAGRALETTLRDIAPRGQVLVLNLNAPRPVAAPFLLRVLKDQAGIRVAGCSADTEEAQGQIAGALVGQGMVNRLNCPLALGSPSPRWGDAASAAIAALGALPQGTLTMADGDVTLETPFDTPQAVFDRAAAQLEQVLPAAFSLRAVRLEAPVDAGTQADQRPEFRAELSAEGRLVATGRLPNPRIRSAIVAFAGAKFGTGATEVTARVDETLPDGWSVRVLSALDALAELHHGRALITPEMIEITGVSGNPDAADQVTLALVQALGDEKSHRVDITYDEALDPVTNQPTPDSCERDIHAILEESKITFDPGSTEINAAAGRVIDRIADVLRGCGELPFEIAGYTDSQGRAETNQALSQARAEAVINALLARRVLVSELVARGYGADNPIADNATEAGRETNRRIEFHLIRPEPEPEPIDPALEAQLEFEIQTPGTSTTRPRTRPETAAEAPEN